MSSQTSNVTVFVPHTDRSRLVASGMIKPGKPSLLNHGGAPSVGALTMKMALMAAFTARAKAEREAMRIEGELEQCRARQLTLVQAMDFSMRQAELAERNGADEVVESWLNRASETESDQAGVAARMVMLQRRASKLRSASL